MQWPHGSRRHGGHDAGCHRDRTQWHPDDPAADAAMNPRAATSPSASSATTGARAGAALLRQLASRPQMAAPRTLKRFADMIDRHWNSLPPTASRKTSFAWFRESQQQSPCLSVARLRLAGEEYLRVNVLTCALCRCDPHPIDSMTTSVFDARLERFDDWTPLLLLRVDERVDLGR
jgi:hypothetical protein